MATTITTPTPVVLTEPQSTLLRAFIDQVTAYKYNNSSKNLKSLSLSFNATTGEYSITLDEDPAPVEESK